MRALPPSAMIESWNWIASSRSGCTIQPLDRPDIRHGILTGSTTLRLERCIRVRSQIDHFGGCMRAYVVPKGCSRVDQIGTVERPDPQPGPGQVVVRVRAASLNSRDQAVVAGTYVGGAVNRDTIPLSDGAGEVTAVGAGVNRIGPGS